MVVHMITTTAMILTEIASLSFLIPRTLAGLQTTKKNKKVGRIIKKLGNSGGTMRTHLGTLQGGHRMA